jgi:hypothetical protein
VNTGRLAIRWGIVLCVGAVALFALPSLLSRTLGIWNPWLSGGVALIILDFLLALVLLIVGVTVLVIGIRRRTRARAS